jgi:hypothetical protein
MFSWALSAISARVVGVVIRFDQLIPNGVVADQA